MAAGLVIRFLSDQIEKTKPTGAFAALGRLAPGTVRKSSLRITDLPAVSLIKDPGAKLTEGRSDHAVRSRYWIDTTRPDVQIDELGSPAFDRRVSR